MKASAELFELISSLNTNEKRYFKLYASKYTRKDSSYLRLFDAINQQTTKGKYDETEIKRKFKDEKFARQLHVAKNYLTRLIQRSLLAFHAELNVDFRIYEQLQIADVLNDKGLTRQALKALRKARKLAIDYHQYTLLIKILEKEERLATRQLRFDRADELLQEQRAELQECLNLIENKKFGVTLYNYYLRITEGRSEQDEETFRQLIDFEELDDEDGATNTRARIYKYTGRILYESFLGNVEKQIEYQYRIISIYEENQKLIAEDPRQFLVAMHNLNQGLFRQRRYRDVLETNDKIRETIARYKVQQKHEIEALHGVAEMELWIKIALGLNDSEIRESIQYTESIYDRSHGQMHAQDTINLLYSLGFGYFYLGEMKESLRWLNRLLNERFKEVREDLQAAARILNLVIHFELSNHQLLDYLEKSAYRFLNSRKQYFKVESSILKFFRQQARVKDRKGLEAALTRLRDECVTLSKDPYEKRMIEYFDIITWADSHLQNRPFAELQKERIGKH